MLTIFKTTPAGLARLEEFEPDSWIDLVSPTEEELEQVSRELQIPLDLLKGPLDEEEKSRIDVEDGLTHVIVDIPVLVREEDQLGYETIPLGMLIHHDYFITTCLRTNPILGEFERGVVRGFATFWKTRFMLQILQRVSAFYLRYLGRIDRETDKVEKELRASMKNAEIFDLLEKFAGYGFNKSHSVAYALVAYHTAWLKANYPVEFMAALLTSEIGKSAINSEDKENKLVTYIGEAQDMDIAIAGPSVNKSQKKFSIEDHNGKPAIRFALTAVKNVSEGVVETMVAERAKNGPFRSFDRGSRALMSAGGGRRCG